MTTVDAAVPAGVYQAPMPLEWLRDARLMAGRNLRRIARAPDVIFTMAVAPIMFFVFFRYVFGGAIQVPGDDYTQFLIPGFLVGMSLFVAVPAMAVAIAQDLRNGVTDRFRSLPMTRSSVLFGHSVAEVARYSVSIAVQVAIGLIAGFRFHGGLGASVAAIALLLLWCFALAWVGAAIGLLARSVEAAQGMSTMLLAPLGFISSVYVPPESMPLVLRVIAEHNPITHMTDTIRALLNGTPTGSALWASLAWIAAIILVFGTLAVSRFRRVAS
jgi:ABC transporter DrrB family efflux protein